MSPQYAPENASGNDEMVAGPPRGVYTGERRPCLLRLTGLRVSEAHIRRCVDCAAVHAAGLAAEQAQRLTAAFHLHRLAEALRAIDEEEGRSRVVDLGDGRGWDYPFRPPSAPGSEGSDEHEEEEEDYSPDSDGWVQAGQEEDSSDEWADDEYEEEDSEEDDSDDNDDWVRPDRPYSLSPASEERVQMGVDHDGEPDWEFPEADSSEDEYGGTWFDEEEDIWDIEPDEWNFDEDGGERQGHDASFD
ncbi:hypothetical protein NKR23_g4433 [Pleurostoma richardsiae]|uniref:Uncharacterized protein n=1 Tax=Pleurostoma richardsiae TaxID=41990 RepID=A0AA38S4Y6_9PEZI|nr:hypothetical protein NKR23_g4433 [Pleurostoma richardsiae]